MMTCLNARNDLVQQGFKIVEIAIFTSVVANYNHHLHF